MRKEKVNFPKAKFKNNKKLTLPIELYYSKIGEVLMLIGLIVGLAIIISILSKTSAFSDNIVFGFIITILGIIGVYKIVDFSKSMQYDNPNIIIEQDCLYLLYDDYVLAEFDEMEYIEITSITRNRGSTEFYLKMTIVDEYIQKGKYISYSMSYGFMYVNGKSISAYQAFDLIWQVFWNYHEETNYPLRLRKKEEWEWWE